MFIVLGSGLFKTCISVMVGTLYKKGDARRDGGFSLFYMGINLGSFIAPLISGWLIKTHGWHWGLVSVVSECWWHCSSSVSLPFRR